MTTDFKKFIIQVPCFHFQNDIVLIKKLKIDISDYSHFVIILQSDGWHIKGVLISNQRLGFQELSDHVVSNSFEMAKFIFNVEKLYPNYSKILSFTNYCSSKNFSKELKILLDLIDELKNK